MRALLVLALLVPLAACGGSSDAPDPSAAAPSAAAPSAAAPSAAVPSGAASVPAAGATLVLRADGLVLQAGGSSTPIPFGSGTSVVAPAIAAALGEPQQQTVECGQGPRTALGGNGFDVLFDGERFVGWDEAGAGLVTDTGLRVGSTKADVLAALPGTTFSQSSLGDEFSSPGGLSGFLDGPADTSKVIGLVGGESCAVR